LNLSLADEVRHYQAYHQHHGVKNYLAVGEFLLALAMKEKAKDCPGGTDNNRCRPGGEIAAKSAEGLRKCGNGGKICLLE